MYCLEHIICNAIRFYDGDNACVIVDVVFF